MGIGTEDPEATLHVNGTAAVAVLQITGGGDLAEPFLVEEQMEIAKQRTVGLPVIVFIVSVQEVRVGDLSLELHNDRVVRCILLGDALP